MALSRLSRNRRSSGDHWPGFVDALSALLMVVIFFLSVFMLAQFFLTDALSGRDKAIAAMRAEMSELADLLALERKASAEAAERVATLSAALDALRAEEEATQAELAATQSALADQEELTAEAESKLDILNAQLAQLRNQLASLQKALEAAEERDKKQKARIANLGKRLNAALAQKVDELARFRSEFFGLMIDALKGRDDVRIEGDRFVFQSEILFNSGSAELGTTGKSELLKIAIALLEISEKTPASINWILRVDGHTDAVPINTAQYPSNWELSQARAVAVVKFLESQGVPGYRLAATGFGQYQPIAQGKSATANLRNRRIEFKITSR